MISEVFNENCSPNEKSDSQIFYAPPMRPRLTAKELKQILGAEPLVVQIKREKMTVTVINEIDRYIDNYYAQADSLETRESDTEWLHPLNSQPFTSLNRPPLSKQKEKQIA